MSIGFTNKDLAIFAIPGFKERMVELKAQIRPKLEACGDEIAPVLMKQFKKEFFPHTAKHLRRTVNPPDETWVAFGPQSRGYKAYVYFAFCIGKNGAGVRVVMKQESDFRSEMGRNLLSNIKFFNKRAKSFSGLVNFLKRDDDYRGMAIGSLGDFIEDSGDRLLRLKSATFEVGLELKPLSKTLKEDILQAMESLFPFYACGLDKKVKFS